MNWRTTNLAKFIVTSPKAILPLFSQMKQVELSQTMPTKFHRDESQDKVQTKKLFSKCTLFMCALSPLITIYLWLTHRIKHTCMYVCAFTCSFTQLFPIVLSWCVYKVLDYLELFHFYVLMWYSFKSSFWTTTLQLSLEYTISMLLL